MRQRGRMRVPSAGGPGAGATSVGATSVRATSVRAIAVLGVAVLAAVAMSGPAPGAARRRSSDPILRSGVVPPVPPVPAAWTPCPTGTGYQCATVRVPLDYRHPAGPTIPLAVIRRRATGPGPRLGSLFFNPGGPGESGVQILPVVASLLPPAVTARFDLVSFDERGTGASDKLVCGPAPAAVASALPVPAGGAPLPAAPMFETMRRHCARADGALLGSVDTTNSARDMDRIRQALGEPTISYYGTSYGTVLGSVYARLFPTHVRAMVLDGAVDVTLPLATQAEEEAPAIQASLEHFFSTCRPAPHCPLGADPAAAYRRLDSALQQHPLPAPGAGDPYPVTAGDLATATLFALTVPDFAPGFGSALAAAARGDGAPLRALSLVFEQDLDNTSLVPALWAFTCNDSAQHPDAAAAGALARSLAARYPLDGVAAVANNLEGCVGWPRPAQPITALRLSGTPRLVVIGNTGDPNTPHLAAEQLTRALGAATLLTWNGFGHTWLLNDHSDPCVAQAVADYLVDRVSPPAGLRCP